MWSRAQLKTKAKYAIKQNYWKIILVTLLVYIIGGASTGFSSGFNEGFEDGKDSAYMDSIEESMYDLDEEWQDDFAYEFEEDYETSIEEDMEDILDEITSESFLPFLGIVVIVFLVVFVIAVVVTLLISAFLYNPLEVGTKRFFFKSLNEKAEVKEVAFAFDNSYKNVVKILFFRSLYTFLWSLLFVIPGIIKGYEYMMIPYLLAENPNLTMEQAFALSKQMMQGQKWRAFVLELSFIGWDILSIFTLGTLSLFYVEPYKNLTYAALYEELSIINGRPASYQVTDYTPEYTPEY